MFLISDITLFSFKYNYANRSLKEFSITILPTKFPLNRIESIARYYFRNVDNSVILRALRSMLFSNQPLWLRPYLWMNIDLFNELLNEAIKIEIPYIVMMFHSSELMAGCSKYRNDKEPLKNYVIS